MGPSVRQKPQGPPRTDLRGGCTKKKRIASWLKNRLETQFSLVNDPRIGPMESDPWVRFHGIGPMESDPWKSKKKIPNKETKKNQKKEYKKRIKESIKKDSKKESKKELKNNPKKN